MSDSDLTALQQAIQERWSNAGGPKVTRYVGKFWDRQRRERKITAVVQGNHGDYTVASDVLTQCTLLQLIEISFLGTFPNLFGSSPISVLNVV